MRFSAASFAIGLAALPACSASGPSDRLPLGSDSTGGRSAMVPGSGGSLSLGGAATATSLRTHVEHEHVKVDIVTLACPGDCVDVVAVATGGNGAISFTWEDGSTSPQRRLCPSATQAYEVTAKDTAVTSGEFPRAAETARASVTASVLASCPVPDGGVVIPPESGPPPVTGCSPFRLLASVASGFAIASPPLSGFSADFGAQVIVISQASLPLRSLDPACPRLLLAGDSAGTLPIGFDNNLLFELRPAEGTPVEKRWYYGGGVILFGGVSLPSPIPPTVSGLLLGIPNPVPFGYEPLAVDLATQIAGYESFHVTATVIDSGAFGSNTEIWVIPR